METLGNMKVAKSCTEIYKCEYCDYSTSRKSSYDKHLATDKHRKRIIEDRSPHICSCGKVFTRSDNLSRHKKTCTYAELSLPKVAKVANCFQMFPNQEEGNICECGRSYKTRSGLWKHQKICKFVTSTGKHIDAGAVQSDNTQVLEILGTIKEDNQSLKEDNKLLKEKLSELESGIMDAVSEPKVVNNYNNIIVLLNQKCGNAVAIDDFAKQIAMSLEDVSYALENGKAKGIENIIRKRFEELGTFSRPLHCTDIKRGTTYVKGDEGWQKDDGKINKMIKDVEFVQTKGIKMWGEANPSYTHRNSKLMDKWLQIVKCLTGSIEGVGMRKIEKRCHEMAKIDQEEWKQ